MEHKIYFSRARRGLGFPSAYLSVRAAALAVLQAQGADKLCEISVLFTDNAGIRILNGDYRGIDSSTDVLSFPSFDMQAGVLALSEDEKDPETGRYCLGDMAISLEQCAKQAQEYGNSFEREIMYLTVHSTLHLLGYDHVDEAEEKRKMRAREKEIMKLLEQ